MKQKLIVEGKDAVVLSNILKKRGLPAPKGYSNPDKYKNEFVKEAGGFSKVELAVEIALKLPDISNIGIIVDANAKGAQPRFESLLEKIETILGENCLNNSTLTDSGFKWAVNDNLTIGIWIMPNNSSVGYLEHFVSDLIAPENKTFLFCKEKINELSEKDFCNFTDVKKQKAILHTYLAWQKSPGLPMGTAVDAGYINPNSPNADSFQTWFENTFELEVVS